ncbi:unnamed protein product [Prunus armeniaca]|uniref:AAA+ ATPase domain-containing protein n=1 Tax=Prunus armeniaca TaxID=36596 RepID=A0A6J5WXJ8_PRUAR|nr:unnamed protein product [Prunus armeniaca]
MAGDVAQFLRNKFLASLSETESELSGAVLISDLGAIKDIVIAIDTRRLTGDYYCLFISVLLDLTDALTKCQVFSHEWKKHSHHKTHLVVFNHLSLRKICFVRKMKKRLAAIKRIFEAEFMKKEERIYNLRESSSRPDDPEENSEIELPVVEAEVVGFDEQLLKIGNFLLKSSPSSGAGFAAVGIVGMAGVGKTTLVREVLSWWMVLGKFSPIIWLCLSNIIKENKQVEEEIEVSIVKCMLSKLDHDAVADGDGIIQEEEEKTISSNNSGHLLAALLERLNQHLSGKSYLIVLDDVWHMNDFYSDLGQLLEVQEGDKKVGDRLSHGLPKGSGGAIIVTSRIPEVVETMVVPAQGSDKHYKSLIISLEPLDRESCWNIYQDTAFGYQQHLEKVENEIKDLCYGLPLAARTLAEIMSQNSQNFERTSPPYHKSEDLPYSFHIKKSPVLVFIDMSNRQQGEELIGKFCDLLTKEQVFGVLAKETKTYNNPETVLKDVYGTLEKLKQNGYYGLASEIQKKMRIIVVGQDEFVNWILGVICDLKLPESPSIAPVPPPTLKRCGINASFGWKGISNISPLRSFLVDVALAKPMKTDSWHFLIRMKDTQSFPTRLRHYWHEVEKATQGCPPPTAVTNPFRYGSSPKGGKQLATKCVPFPWAGIELLTSWLRDEDNPTLYRRFWHYLILKVGLGIREDLTSIAIVKVLNHLGQWEMLHIPRRINSICCLNLPIFGRSNDRWVAKNTMEDGKTPRILSFIDDGCLEVIGSEEQFSDKSRHRPLLDQVRGIRFEFIEGASGFVELGIDGGMLSLIPLGGLVEIEISYHCQVNFLALPNCPAKSIGDSSAASTFKVPHDGNTSKGDNESEETSTSEDYSEADDESQEASTSRIPYDDGNTSEDD